MQKIATRVFIYSSVLFGILGIFIALTGMDPNEKSHGIELVVTKLFMCTIFVILSSFALSVATKYLDGKK